MNKNILPACFIAGILILALPILSFGKEIDIKRFSPSECKSDNGSEKACRTDVDLCNDDSDNCLRHLETAEDFATFAVMAADTYRAMTRQEWYQFNRTLRIRAQFPDLAANLLLTKKVEVACPSGNCITDNDAWREAGEDQDGEFFYKDISVEELGYDDCKGKELPEVLTKKTEKSVSVPMFLNGGWKRLFQFDRSPPARSFMVFISGLFVEVWRREHPASADGTRLPFSEYAIVFRGTQGAGGWASDLRFLTSTLLIFHDQYDQARRMFPRLREQIRLEEELKDAEMKMENGKSPAAGPPLRGNPFITLVGHSLGAGLAMHVAIHHKGIHRIVGFNPSFITGFMAKDYCTRADNLSTLRSVDFIYENAEVLHNVDPRSETTERVAPTVPTIIRYHMVNMLGGDIFKQHEIGPLACRLAVLKKRSDYLRNKFPAFGQPTGEERIYAKKIESTSDSSRLENCVCPRDPDPVGSQLINGNDPEPIKKCANSVITHSHM